VKIERRRTLRHSEGAQSVFGRTRAEKIIKKLGKGWEVILLEELPKEST
jgi:hypothetical protein